MTDEELRLECLKLTISTFPDAGFKDIDGKEISKYHCRLPKYRTELAEQYFKFIKTSKPAEVLVPFWERTDWEATLLD